MNEVGIKELSKYRTTLEAKFVEVLDSTEELLEPLTTLSKEQRNAVVMLGLLIDTVTLLKRPQARMEEGALLRFQTIVDRFCPPLGGGCDFDGSVL